jgi:DNA-binding transcriptional LysR family regulator
MTLQQLRYLIAVADHGSLTSAAAALDVSQPVLSRALAGLSRDLRMTLLQRSNRRMVLTTEGQQALGPARRALAAADEVTRLALRSQSAPLLRIAIKTSFLALFAGALQRAIAPPANAYVRVSAANTAQVISDVLRNGQADLAFGERPVPSGGLHWVPWGIAEVVLVSPAGLDLPAEIDLRQAAALPLICPPASVSRQHDFDDLLLTQGIKPNVVLEVEDISVYFAMVQAGVGSFFGWRFMCEAVPGIVLRRFSPPTRVEIGFSYAGTPTKRVRDLIARAGRQPAQSNSSRADSAPY